MPDGPLCGECGYRTTYCTCAEDGDLSQQVGVIDYDKQGSEFFKPPIADGGTVLRVPGEISDG